MPGEILFPLPKELMDLNIGPTSGYYLIYFTNSTIMSAMYIWVCKQLISLRCPTWHKLTGSLLEVDSCMVISVLLNLNNTKMTKTHMNMPHNTKCTSCVENFMAYNLFFLLKKELKSSLKTILTT